MSQEAEKQIDKNNKHTNRIITENLISEGKTNCRKFNKRKNRFINNLQLKFI